MKEAISGKWKISGDYAFYVQDDDWVDEDYAAVLIRKLEDLQVNMVISGIIYVHPNSFKRANFYEYEKVLSGKKGRKELIASGYLQNGFCGCLVKREFLQETNIFYDMLIRVDKIGIYNDYKYYHRYEAEETDSFQCLQKRWNMYQVRLTDWKQEEIWKLFTKKERLFLQYPVIGKFICSTTNWLQQHQAGLYFVIQKTVDSQMEKRKPLNAEFERLMNERRINPRILIMGTPEYHNLGDHAIAFAQEQFCRRYFPMYQTINVTEQTILAHFSFLKKQVKDEDILLLQGGGNMGDEYESIEALRLKIIMEFPHNKIVIMPQTIHFTNNCAGQKLLKKMKKIYVSHDKLMLVGRERTSYERMKSYFPKNQIILCPDMVLSLDIEGQMGKVMRNGILLLLRTDAEGTLGVNQLMEIKKRCITLKEEVQMAETSVSYGISEAKRTEELRKKWKQIRGAKLVITDRLHGMIFAAITGTPCLVLSNYNHKIKESYDWIKQLDYIKFCNNLEELKKELAGMDQLCKGQYSYRTQILEVHYNKLAKWIKGEKNV